MAYQDLREFITRLEREGELRRIAAPVDVDLEITEITDRVSKGGGPALYFERPRSARDGRSYAIPLLINALGSKKRLELALEVGSIDDVARRIEALLDMKPPDGLIDKVRLLPKLAEIGSFFPKTVKDGPVKEVAERDNLSLAQFPIMKCWPQDAGRFITFPWSSRAARAPAAATSGATGCRCTTSGPRPCTGRSTRAAPSTSAGSRGKARAT